MIYKTNSGYGVNFNQLAGIATPKTINGITCTHLSDGGYRFTGTANSNGAIFTWNTIDNVIPIPTHKYYIKFLVTDYEEDSLLPRFTANGIGAFNSPYEGIITARENANQTCYSYWNANTRSDCTVYVIQRDLTVMFGSGNEPTTVAEFREMYSDDYYGYTLSQWQWSRKGKITSYPTPCFGVDFNQLVQNGNFESSNGWTTTYGTYSISDGKCKCVPTGGGDFHLTTIPFVASVDVSHKYFCSVDLDSSAYISSAQFTFYWQDFNPAFSVNQGLSHIEGIYTPFRTEDRGCRFGIIFYGTGFEVYVDNLMIIDLTQMYGEGNEPATVEEFRSKFPDTYYPYTLSEMKYIDQRTAYTLLPIEHHIVGLAHYNDGNTDIIYNYAKRELPVGFVRLDYIESTGTQWIDTGTLNNLPDDNNSIYVSLDCRYKELNSSYRQGKWGNRVAFGPDTISFYFGFTNENLWVGTSDLSRHTFFIDSKNLCYGYDDNKYYKSSLSPLSISGTFYLFARNGSFGAENFIKECIYGCIIKINGVLARNFIPCYRYSDGIEGLYDTVGKQFYTNQGTGRFIRGNIIDGGILNNGN